MVEKNIACVEAYYNAMGHKNILGMAQYLHPNVQLITPHATINGKDAVLNAAQGAFTFFDTITMRAKCGFDDSVIVVFNLNCPAPVGTLRSTAFIQIQDGLIVSNELFYDTHLLQQNHNC